MRFTLSPKPEPSLPPRGPLPLSAPVSASRHALSERRDNDDENAKRHSLEWTTPFLSIAGYYRNCIAADQ